MADAVRSVATAEEGSVHRRIRVLMTQEAVDPQRLAGATVVLVDVFLATTTLLTALDNGARRVFAAFDLHDMDRLCGTLDRAMLLRGGEQDALPVEGFDCGPFPEEYPRELVTGRDVVYVSTNGTRALARLTRAGRVLVASLRNAPAVGRFLQEAGAGSVFIVCAGSKGRFSLEDFSAAGVILAHLDLDDWVLNDAAWLAYDSIGAPGPATPARAFFTGARALVERSRAGRWFIEHQMTGILDFVADIGATDLVAEVRDGELRRVAPVEASERTP